MRLTALNMPARKAGLFEGQGVADARAICPHLEIVPADPDADQRLMEAIADWADRYTPLVALSQSRAGTADGLFLDIAGCAHLFGGEAAMLEDCSRRLSHFGIAASAAIAPTPGLAWALARHRPGAIAQSADMQDLISGLPVPALRLPEDMIAALARLGLKYVGDLVTAPRAPLNRRFGPELLERLDQIEGRDGEPISPRRPAAEIMVERRLAEPVTDMETVDRIVGELASSLEKALERRGCGLRQAELILFRVDGMVRRLSIGTARPLRDPKRLKRLFAERLTSLSEEIDVGYGFETIRLAAPLIEPVEEGQTGFDEDASGAVELSALVDQLSTRLGPECVLIPESRDSHNPERALDHLPALHAMQTDFAPSALLRPASGAPRPLRLFRRPEPVTAIAEVPDGPPVTFLWRRSRLRVSRAEGPERIAAEWWIDGEEAPARDYYHVEDEAGRRYWLFREGLYERGDETPRWFLHGLFA